MEINRVILRETFRGSAGILEAENGKQALDLVMDAGNNIAAVLLDIMMPVMDGFGFLEELRKTELFGDLPVFLITADTSDESMRRGYHLGVMDIIEKPIVPYFVKKRVESVMELFRARKKLNAKVEVQEVQLRQKEQEILELNQAIIETLSAAIEFRDGESGMHVKRMRSLTALLLRALRDMGKEKYQFSDEQIEEIAMAAIMHDVGKIAISDAILNKPGKLTPEEFEIMKTHTVKGGEVLELIPQYREKELYRYAYEICLYHHERWDGKGYPKQLKGDEIPIWAQAVSVADVVDALTNKRVYKPAIPFDQALEMIRGGQCGSFNPDLLKALDVCAAQIRGGAAES